MRRGKSILGKSYACLCIFPAELADINGIFPSLPSLPPTLCAGSSNMALTEITNTGAASTASTSKQSTTLNSPGAAPPSAQDVPMHLQDPTFGLGEAVIATPALKMRDRCSTGEGGVCISAAPRPCILETSNVGSAISTDGFSSHFRLAMCYMQGKGVEQDSAKAVDCFTRAADAGDSNAQFNLAVCYTQGLGCVRDDEKAFRYFSLAAAQGDRKAQLQVGVCHIVGRGTTLDESAAATAFRSAAEAGDPTAQYNLGVCLGKGRGVTRNMTEAAQWYLKSAEQGDAMAQFRLALCYATGKGLNKSPKTAVEWYHKAAEAKHGGALFNLGVCHAQGDGVTRSDTQAVSYYREAAELGVVQAQHNLALCLLTGAGTAKDTVQALEWYVKAADQGDAKAQFAAGVCFETAQGTEKDLDRAAKLYSSASNQGNVKAMVALGLCYKTGAGVAVDAGKALTLFEEAAHRGNHRGMYHLGCHHLKQSDVAAATHWFQSAADKGSNDAKEALKRMAEPDKTAKISATRGSRASPHHTAAEKPSQGLSPVKARGALVQDGSEKAAPPSSVNRSNDSMSQAPPPISQGPPGAAVATTAARRLSKESHADLTSTDDMLTGCEPTPLCATQPHRPSDASLSRLMAGVDLSAVTPQAGEEAGDQSTAARPATDHRFSMPAMPEEASASQFDVPGRQSMLHKTSNREAGGTAASPLGNDSVEFRKAYSQSPAKKVRCGFGFSLFRRKK